MCVADALNEDALAYIEELEAKLQFLVNNWSAPLPDGKISFPDGDYIEKSPAGANVIPFRKSRPQ